MTDNDYTAEDQAAVTLLGLGVTVTSLTGMVLATPGGDIPSIAKTAISVSELRPSSPFERASGAWGSLRDELEGYRDYVIGLTSGITEGEDAWSGPGSEAMQTFVEDELVPAFEALINAADDASTICGDLAKHYEKAVGDWFYAAAEMMVLLLAAKALLKIPYVGAALNSAANLGIVIYGLYQDSTILGTLFSDLNDSMSKSADLLLAVDGLRHVLGEKGSSLDKPLETEFAEIESDLEDHDNWDKA